MSTASLSKPGTLVHARGREWVILPESTDDLLMVKPNRRPLAAELKGANGKVEPEQWEQLQYLAGCGWETHVWWPADWPDIVACLEGTSR